MILNTIVRILSFIINGLAVFLLLTGVNEFTMIGLIMLVALVNYFDGLTRNAT